VNVRPHDRAAFTQGLLLYRGSLFESTGRYGQSSLREVDPETGSIRRQVPLDASYFGEGLARVDDRLIQLTWRENTALVYELATFRQITTFTYDGEGWGLCYDGTRLIMSDGSGRLTFRDPTSFDVQGGVDASINGRPLRRLNELECVDGRVFANIWGSNTIVRIDPSTGAVDLQLNVPGLLTPAQAQGTDVLNGIAYDLVHHTLLITGKLWPSLFEVRLNEPGTTPVSHHDPSPAAKTPSCGALGSPNVGAGLCALSLVGWARRRTARATTRR